ncbi:MAG: hypothetical protein MR654_04510 [Corynebacterium glucuronolyticum]|nr:hypothetical protein [Corynebacterium glucuronolyticum]
MKLLTRVSIASVIVSVPAIAWTFLVLAALLTNSVIPFGGGLASLSFIFILLVAGHALCLVGFLIQTVLLCFPTTGWELLFLPLALGPG